MKLTELNHQKRIEEWYLALGGKKGPPPLDEHDARGADYSRLIGLLIEAVKTQPREIRQQRSEIASTRREIRREQALLGRKERPCRTSRPKSVPRQSLHQVKAQLAAGQPTLVAAR